MVVTRLISNYWVVIQIMYSKYNTMTNVMVHYLNRFHLIEPTISGVMKFFILSMVVSMMSLVVLYMIVYIHIPSTGNTWSGYAHIRLFIHSYHRSPERIQWFVDGTLVRTRERKDTCDASGVCKFPSEPA